MSVKLKNKMDEAWDYIWAGLFNPQTRLFYDYRTSLHPETQFAHLPTPEEIALQFPNPAGWGTGMEDSMLNAGSVMEILCLRKELESYPEALSLASQVLGGILSCAYGHGVDGFLVRSLCPDDGQSCYFNSSRDQFTLAVYGVWRFLNTFPEAPEKLRADAKRLLVDIARYCERVIDPDHDDLLRLDGKPALVSTMVNVAPHERLRLPMFYAAAWAATDDPHWFDLYRQYARSGIVDTLAIDRSRRWWDWELPQLQLSLARLREIEPEAVLKKQYADAMLITADLASRELRDRQARAAGYLGNWDVPNLDWRQMPMTTRPETLTPSSRSMLFGGYPYLMPQFPEAFHTPYSLLRGVGNLAYAALMCPEFKPLPDLLTGFLQTAIKPNYSQHHSDGAINILHGYWIGLNRSFF